MRSGVHHEMQGLLRGGLSPSDLALAVTVGIVIGCLPIFGVSTLLCAGLALAMRLNLIAIQAANWVAMPLQVLLFLPFLRLGRWLLGQQRLAQAAGERLPWTDHAARLLPVTHLLPQIGWLLAHLFVAWLVVALPVAILLHATLRRIFFRMASSLHSPNP